MTTMANLFVRSRKKRNRPVVEQIPVIECFAFSCPGQGKASGGLTFGGC